MFKTLKSKISLVVIGVVSLTLCIILFLVQSIIERDMMQNLEHDALTLMKMIHISIDNQYESVRFYENSVMDMRKRELKNVVALAYRVIEEEYELYKSGLLTEETAKKNVVKRIKKMRYDDGIGYFWINDMGVPYPEMIMHPTIPELDGTILDDEKFNCALGIRKNLFVAFVDVCREAGSGFVDYLWPKPTEQGLTSEQPKISFVQLFKEWNWVIGSGVYIDDIEAEVQKRKDAIVAELQNTMTHISVGKTGYIFIFDGDRNLLVHPTLAGRNGSALINPSTGGFILDDLIKASKNSQKAFRYLWDKPQFKGNYIFWKRAYVEYFKELGWYIGSSVYEDEIIEPINELNRKIIFLGILFLLIAVFIIFLLTGRVVRPLKNLAHAVESIDQKGLDVFEIPISGTTEVRSLANVFAKMLESIRETMQELKRTKSYLNNIINSMPSALIGIDSDGNVTNMNIEAERFLINKQEPTVGLALDQVFPQCKDYIDELKKAVSVKEIVEKTNVAFDLNNDNRIVNITAYPLITNGIKGAVVRIDDVTEKARLEDMMIQTEKMMSVGGLAAGMAHEINNPLGAVLQSTQNILRRLDPAKPKNIEVANEFDFDLVKMRQYLAKRDIDKFLNGIKESGERASKIVANMLQFSRQSSSVLVECDLVELIEKTIELAANDYDLKKKYDFRHVEIIREYAQDIKDVPCVMTEIEQVFLNLFKNSAYAMSLVDNIEPIIHIRLKKERHCLKIDIEDNGPGMDEATRKRVFEPFFTTKPVGVGTGLGLSVSYFIITEKHGGNMDVVSKLNQGTKFTITLPC